MVAEISFASRQDKYTIEINSIDDLVKLYKEYKETSLIIDFTGNIILVMIYDGYIE